VKRVGVVQIPFKGCGDPAVEGAQEKSICPEKSTLALPPLLPSHTVLASVTISGVENGRPVPAIERLEKFARAWEVPLYQLFYDGDKPPQLPNLPKPKISDEIVWEAQRGGGPRLQDSAIGCSKNG
jgi:transcriptional regulator with XRE-family HTH domain